MSQRKRAPRKKKEAKYSSEALAEDPVFEGVKRRRTSGPRKKSTDINLTINLNRQFQKLSPEEKKQFKDFTTELFDDKYILDYITDAKSPEDNTANIDPFDLSYQFEIGPDHGMLHVHAYIPLRHYGHLKFHPNELRAFAKEYFGHNVHVDSNIGSNTGFDWETYLNKSVDL